LAKKYTAHVVSQTHWDREWYRPFQTFRMRLVDMIDDLLNLMESNPEYKYFTFDGQVVVIDDYLQIRPENESRLRKLIDDGRIMLGPWYNQPDEFIVSGESLIRNLLLGLEKCRDYGGYLNAGYVPDCFGHISQLPQILLGFGIDNAILFRGITQDQTASQFIWESPDGSSVLTFKLPDERAYSDFLYALIEVLRDDDKPVDKTEACKALRVLLDDSINLGATTSQLLFMDGVDHVFAQYKTPEIIKYGNEEFDDLTLIHSTIPAFIDAYKKERPDLAKQSGELRSANRDWTFQAILAHVMSSRVNIKQANHNCEILLEKYVEPLCSWAWWLGDDYPKSYIDLAWKYLLLNSPHDSICGCSVDQVHRDMMYRYDQSRIISENLLKKAAASITGKIAVTADAPEKTYVTAVFNTQLGSRTDIIEADIFVPGAIAVGSVKVLNTDGYEIPSAMLCVDHPANLLQTPHDIPRDAGQQRIKIAFKAEDVPGIGYKAYRIEVSDKPNRQIKPLLTAPNRAENEFISLQLESNGSLTLIDKETGKTYPGLLVFEDGSDIGDGYNYRAPMNDSVVLSTGMRHSISVEENNAVRVVFKVTTDFVVPASVLPDMTRRSEETTVCHLESRITLAAGIKRVDIKTTVDNTARYHRLRVLFPTGLNCTVSHAEQAFDVVERSIKIPLCPDWREPMPSTQPQKTFVDLSDGISGLTLINRGLQEYEAIDDESRTLALTLLRSNYGWPGESGPVRDAQLLGTHCFEYAIYPHAGDWERGRAYLEAHAFNVPFICSQGVVGEGVLPMECSLVSLENKPFVLSALKKAEKMDSLILRGYNIGTEDIVVKIKTDAVAAETVDLKEDSQAFLDVKNIDVSARTKGIVSIKLSK